MKCVLSGIICFLPLSLFCQVEIGKAWTLECGLSSNTLFKQGSSLNLRFISPRFKWSEDWFEDEEKHPEKYQNSRLMVEVIYRPPLNVLCLGLNVQERFIRYKAFSMELYGGLKFFFVQGQDFANVNSLQRGKDAWYINVGILCQFDLGGIGPFADFGRDRIVTIGTEVNYHLIFKKLKKRYRPPYMQG